MGRSVLQKALSAGAQAGANFVQKNYFEQQRAEIQANRDKVLNGYRSAAEAESQSFQAEQQGERITSAEKIAANNLEASKNSPQALLAQKKLESLKILSLRVEEYAKAETDEERQRIGELINLENGKYESPLVSTGGLIFNKTKGKYLDNPNALRKLQLEISKVSANIYAASSASSGATYESIREGVEKEVLGGEAPRTDEYEVGKTYEDADGNKAIYRGDGEWENL